MRFGIDWQKFVRYWLECLTKVKKQILAGKSRPSGSYKQHSPI
jgi:hypothetical protein